jgi:hypothetical protein
MSQRMIRVGAMSTPESMAADGRGEVRELWEANKTWLSPGFSDYPGRQSAFTLWNPGQQMVVPAKWQAIAGEYESK